MNVPKFLSMSAKFELALLYREITIRIPLGKSDCSMRSIECLNVVDTNCRCIKW